jgi:hypothetical protein
MIVVALGMPSSTKAIGDVKRLDVIENGHPEYIIYSFRASHRLSPPSLMLTA